MGCGCLEISPHKKYPNLLIAAHPLTTICKWLEALSQSQHNVLMKPTSIFFYQILSLKLAI
jgi:hypothetical protein